MSLPIVRLRLRRTNRPPTNPDRLSERTPEVHMQLQAYAKRYLPRPVIDVLRMMKYRMDLATFSKRVVTRRYGRHELRMNIHDRVAGEWYDKDWALPPEIEFMSHGRVPRAAACLI